MREAALALAEADKLLEQYGRDGNDGAVIRFRMTFLVSDRTMRPASPAEIVNSTFSPLVHKTFDFAAIRADGLWYTTGGGPHPQAVEWEDLLEWLDGDDQHLRVDTVEWLSHGFPTKIELMAPATADVTPGDRDPSPSASVAEGTGTNEDGDWPFKPGE